MKSTLKTPYPLTNYIIAIDGPAGAGKGTLARGLAKYYRVKYLDTGTLYRTVALNVLNAGGNPAHEADALAGCSFKDFDFRHVGDEIFSAIVDGVEINAELRRENVGKGASEVAFFPSVRSALMDFQVEFAQLWASRIGVILDGRDIGTAICPNADFKFFLDADIQIRALRRTDELNAQNKVAGINSKQIDVNIQETLADILARDARDKGRKNAPLKAAADAVLINSNNLNAEEVLQFVIGIIEDNL